MTITPEGIQAAVSAGVESGVVAAMQKRSVAIGCTTCLIYTTDKNAVEKHKNHHAMLDDVEGVKTGLLSSLKQAAISFLKWAVIAALLLVIIGLTRITWTDVLAAFGAVKGNH